MKKKTRPEIILFIMAIVIVFAVLISQAAIDRSDAALYSADKFMERQAREIHIIRP